MTKYNKSGYGGHRGALSVGQKGFSGGGSGGGGGCVAASGAVDQVYSGTATNYRFPAYGLYNYGITYELFTQSDIQASLGSGQQRLTSIAYRIKAGWTSGYTYNNQTIKIAHVDSSITDIPNSTWNVGLDNAAAASVISDITTCKSNFTWQPSLTSSGNWDTITLDNYFCYNGTSNLLLIWENNDGTWASGYGAVHSYFPGGGVAPFRSGFIQQDANFPTSAQLIGRYNFMPIVRFGH